MELSVLFLFIAALAAAIYLHPATHNAIRIEWYIYQDYFVQDSLDALLHLLGKYPLKKTGEKNVGGQETRDYAHQHIDFTYDYVHTTQENGPKAGAEQWHISFDDEGYYPRRFFFHFYEGKLLALLLEMPSLFGKARGVGKAVEAFEGCCPESDLLTREEANTAYCIINKIRREVLPQAD